MEGEDGMKEGWERGRGLERDGRVPGKGWWKQ